MNEASRPSFGSFSQHPGVLHQLHDRREPGIDVLRTRRHAECDPTMTVADDAAVDNLLAGRAATDDPRMGAGRAQGCLAGAVAVYLQSHSRLRRTASTLLAIREQTEERPFSNDSKHSWSGRMHLLPTCNVPLSGRKLGSCSARERVG